jgi:hypothetical protein
MDLKEIGLGSTDCINLAQARDKRKAVVNVEINLLDLQIAGCF